MYNILFNCISINISYLSMNWIYVDFHVISLVRFIGAEGGYPIIRHINFFNCIKKKKNLRIAFMDFHVISQVGFIGAERGYSVIKAY